MTSRGVMIADMVTCTPRFTVSGSRMIKIVSHDGVAAEKLGIVLTFKELLLSLTPLW